MTEEKPKFKQLQELIMEMCEDCGWYNDCPLNYKCPPMEVIITILEEEEDD